MELNPPPRIWHLSNEGVQYSKYLFHQRRGSCTIFTTHVSSWDIVAALAHLHLQSPGGWRLKPLLRASDIRPYQWSVTGVGVFLVEVLLKLWKLAEVPVLFSQPFSRVAKLSWRGSTLATRSSSTKARGSTIPKQTEKHTLHNAQQETWHRSVLLNLYVHRTIKSSFLKNAQTFILLVATLKYFHDYGPLNVSLMISNVWSSL